MSPGRCLDPLTRMATSRLSIDRIELRLMQTFETPLVKLDATNVRLRSHSLRLDILERRILEVQIGKATPGLEGPPGPRGAPGPEGPPGETGPMPRHQWRGTELRFESAPNEWGKFVDLKGSPGQQIVVGGPAAPIEVFG